MLTPTQRDIAFKTIGSTSLYYLALDALENREPFSIVRMADGEKHLMDLAIKYQDNDQLLRPGLPGAHKWLTEQWLRNMGLWQIPLSELRARLDYAAEHCTYFAPSPTGFVDPEYNIYDYWSEPGVYAEHFYNILWNEGFKEELFRRAGHVLCIHGNANTADSMQLRVQANLGVKVTWLKLNAWTQTHAVIAKANTCTAPLVLFSGGPSGKIIGPMLAGQLVSKPGRVVLDVGNQMDRFTFSHLPIDRDKAGAFHVEWSKTNKQWEEPCVAASQQ